MPQVSFCGRGGGGVRVCYARNAFVCAAGQLAIEWCVPVYPSHQALPHWLPALTQHQLPLSRPSCVLLAADELLLRQKAMRQLGRMLHMDNLRATADQQRIVIDVTRGRHTCNQILKTTQATQAGCKALGDVVQDMATKLSQLQARLEQSEASMRQEESEEERRLQQAAAEAAAAAQAAAHAAAAEKAAAEAAAVASQLWRQIDQLPAAGPVGVAEGEPAGEAKGAAAVPDSAADEAGPGQGAAAGIEATAAAEGAAAAAVPAGFTACANPLFGSGGGCTPLPPHGHRRMLAAAAEKEQRAAN